MRKSGFVIIDKYIDLFKKLHQGIEAELADKSGNYAKVSGYLQTCQDKAIELGTMIENSEGLGHPTVTHLEEYCEEIFSVNEDIYSEHGLSAQSARTRLDGMLVRIQDSVAKDIAVGKVVVFLPYKASMWDSLESVYKRYAADENTEAFVIPIPYYDKNPDGSFKKMNYEGAEYPSDIPITDYNEFDFEAAHPDEIYIHNPYDDLNYVTSVHPFFYSSKLKKFTDKLIYIPYFVIGEPDVSNDEALEHIEAFALTKGVLNADEVILQSENMKAAYVKVLSKHFGEETRATWEAKIKGTGSPKFEKVMSLKRENQDIPADWLELMKKPDGSLKKVIFYNTSVTTFLKEEENMLLKIEDALRIFKENKDNVTLLWRPHPLMQATIESMSPECREHYNSIVEQYRQEGWGIYDDTADMDRAIAISDGYYGDPSSIVQLYEKTGKPIMIQNANVRGE